VIFAVVFCFPLYLADSAAEALESLAGGTGLLWAMAGLFLARLLPNAAAAARRVRVTTDGLRFESLLGARTVALHDIKRVEPLLQRGEPVGYRLHPASGAPIDLDWSQMIDVEPAHRALEPYS
jgi:hypothetical protein